MRHSPTRRIWVPFKFEPEVSERHGKSVKLDGRTYLVTELKISGAEPIGVGLLESTPPENDEPKNIEHWMKR